MPYSFGHLFQKMKWNLSGKFHFQVDDSCNIFSEIKVCQRSQLMNIEPNAEQDKSYFSDM